MMQTDYWISSIARTPSGRIQVSLITADWQRMSVMVASRRTGTAELDTTIRRMVAARANPRGAPITMFHVKRQG